MKKLKLRQLSTQRTLIFVLFFAVLGVSTILITHAATSTISVEPENGALKGATLHSDSSASGGKYVQFNKAASNPCAATAHTVSYSSLTQYANQAGDQVIVVPDGTYVGGGTVTKSHPSTSGPCKGWLVVMAATPPKPDPNDPTKTIYSATINLTSNKFTINSPSSRIMFVGFRFTGDGPTVMASNYIAFWYDLFDASPSHQSSPIVDDLYMNNDSNIHNRVYGSEIINACDGIDVSGSTDLKVVGTYIHDLYDADGPDSKGGIHCHSDNIDDVGGKLANLHVDYSNLGRMEMEAHFGTITGLTITNSWITNSVGIGLHLANEGTTITGSIDNTHFFHNAGLDILSEGTGSAKMTITNTTCQKSYPGCTLSSVIPPASDNPVNIWKNAHPYQSWTDFLE